MDRIDGPGPRWDLLVDGLGAHRIDLSLSCLPVQRLTQKRS
jgi:hypothetical protein